MRTYIWLIPLTLLLLAAGPLAHPGAPAAQRPTATAPSTSFKPIATVKDVMDYIVIPASDALFGAVSTVQGPNGIEDKAPQTDQEWEAVRKEAFLLAEAGNLLLVPGRHIAGAGDKSANPGTELEPAQMEALVAKNRGAWTGAAQGLVEASLLAMKAIDAKNAEELSNAGGEIDAACESCHLRFWYPPNGK